MNIASDVINEDIARLLARQESQEVVRVFEGIRLGTPEAYDDVCDLLPERFRTIVDLLMDPVILPTGNGGHVFNPDRFQPNWKH